MLTLPIALVMGVLFLIFGHERAANIAAHEICPNTHVVRAGDDFEFGCDGHQYRVLCDDGRCTVQPLEEPRSQSPETS